MDRYWKKVDYLYLVQFQDEASMTDTANDHNNEELQLPAEATSLQCKSDHDLRSPCYCEENVWRLVYRHLQSGLSAGWHYHVVFISNMRKCCPMFMQRAVDLKDYVCWDYHVIVVRTRIGSSAVKVSEVLDIDTWLTPYPCPFQEYISGSFPHALDRQIDEDYLPLFRVVDAKEYLEQFYSDRMHMFKDGKWSAPPPNYKPIMNGFEFARENGRTGHQQECKNLSNLEKYIDMSEEQSTGRKIADTTKDKKPLCLEEFRLRFM